MSAFQYTNILDELKPPSQAPTRPNEPPTPGLSAVTQPVASSPPISNPSPNPMGNEPSKTDRYLQAINTYQGMRGINTEPAATPTFGGITPEQWSSFFQSLTQNSNPATGSAPGLNQVQTGGGLTNPLTPTPQYQGNDVTRLKDDPFGYSRAARDLF
jgi:hypothetical protein